MNNLTSRLPSLTTLLWILASLVAFGAFLFIAPNLLNPPAATATPTGIAVQLSTVQPTATLPNTPSPVPLAPPARASTPEPLPTVAPDAVEYVFIADPTRSGYVTSRDEKLHWADRNLHAGFFADDAYAGILFFDISALSPNSEILAADLQLTGLSRDNLGAQGEWRAALVRLPPNRDWEQLTASELLGATSTTTIGSLLDPTELANGQVNQFRFSSDQLPALANEIQERTALLIRMEGPSGTSNNLFTWDSGGLDLKTGAHPTLRIVARPGQFVVVTNTPTAENVITAAAIALRQTASAASVGTPTPFPRSYATATPIILVTREATPENVETRVALAQLATAVAITTGTYTPTPVNWVLITATFTPAATRTPQAIPVSTLYAQLTPTLQPTNTPTIRQLLETPMPDFLKGDLLIITDRFQDPSVAVMRPDGTLTQGLTGSEYYQLALTREPFSPDRRWRAVVAPDSNGILQIWIQDQITGDQRLITNVRRGIAYDPVWSPDGSRIAYVSRETGSDELFIYDLGAQTSRQITSGGDPFVFKQRPTWSPDGNEVAFKSNQGTPNFQIWIVGADGSNLRNVSRSDSNDTDPVWVKS